MRRRHLFEFTDLSGSPQLLRCFVTEFLRTIVEIFRPFDECVDLLVDNLRATSEERVVDLCSGGAGPWRRLGPLLRAKSGRGVSIVLTDKFPNRDALAPSSDDGSTMYWPDAVDALNVPPELQGMRTLFDGFHHFPPDAAEKILRDAIRSGSSVAIFEALVRSWKGLLVSLCSPIGVLLLTPFVAPFRWSRILFTYVVPVAPFLVTWEAAVSTLRCYTPDELLAIARRAGGREYAWSAGTYWKRGVPVTYLVGHPDASAGEARV